MKIKFLMVLVTFVFCVNFNSFSENSFTGKKQLIMGWVFTNEDSAQQTNVAIEAILKYVEAARYQMESYEKYNPSCEIELYRDKYMVHSPEENESGRVFIYVIERSDSDYHDRYIEINFYIKEDIFDKLFHKYILVLYYNNYNWLENNNGEYYFELLKKGGSAFNYFISKIEEFRR
jgi:hypothetical protein